MSLRIRPVTSRADLARFIGLPPEIYKGMPGFVAPLRMDRSVFLDPRKSAFYKTGRAQYWLALRGDRIVGRISAQISEKRPLGLPPDAGQFGAIDAIDDPEVVAALLRQAEDWLVAQKCASVFGPTLLSMNQEPGLMIKGRQEPPMIMTPWHPEYLERHIRANGYRPLKDLYHYKFTGPPNRLVSDLIRKGPRPQPGRSIRHLDMRHLGRDLAVIAEIYNQAWSRNWGFIPIDAADMQALGKDMKWFMRKEDGLILFDGDKPVATALMLPNINELTADLGADPSLLGWVKLGMRCLRPKFRTRRFLLLGMVPEGRGSLANRYLLLWMVSEFLRSAEEQNVRLMEAGWVLDDNHLIQHSLDACGFTRSKTFRLFEKSLAPTA